MAALVRAIEATKIPPDGMLTVRVGGESVLIANVEGKYYAMGAICAHA